MSGRLVILPKKSWHVWNRENVKKVKRDERLDREANEKKESYSKDITREHNLSKLQKQAVIASTVETTSASLEPIEERFRLFEDIEKSQVTDNADNDEYRQEKEAEELLKKRREGIAPWALGDGAAEKNKIKPWYHYPSEGTSRPVIQIRGQMVMGEEAVLAKTRESKRKRAADPMADFLKYSNQETDIQEKPLLLMESTNHDKIMTITNMNTDKSNNTIPGVGDLTQLWGLPQNPSHSLLDSYPTTLTHPQKHHYKRDKSPKKLKSKSDRHDDESDSDSTSSSSSSMSKNKKKKAKKRKESKHKKRKHKRKHEHQENNDDDNHNNYKCNEENESGTKHSSHIANKGVSSGSSSSADFIASLRRRRVEREQSERRKASLLLSTVDVYGLPPNGSKKPRYNQQYNPSDTHRF